MLIQSRYSPHKRARIRAFFAEGVNIFLLPGAVEALHLLLPTFPVLVRRWPGCIPPNCQFSSGRSLESQASHDAAAYNNVKALRLSELLLASPLSACLLVPPSNARPILMYSQYKNTRPQLCRHARGVG